MFWFRVSYPYYNYAISKESCKETRESNISIIMILVTILLVNKN